MALQTDATVTPATVVVNASAPTPPITAGGATGWGALRATPVDWDTTVGNTFRGLLGAAITDQRLVFNRIGTADTVDGDKTATLHTKPWADLRVTNTTGSPIAISSITTVGDYSVSGFGGGSLGAGATTTLRVTFDYCRVTCPDHTTRVVQGQLRIANGASGTAVMPLYGLWQYADGGSFEPTAAQFVTQTLGFTTRLVGNPAGGSTDAQGRYMGINYGNGSNVAVGDEVLSQFWQATGGPIQIRQVVGSSGGGQQPFGYFPQGSPNSFTQVVRHASTDYQTILPGGTGFSAEATFAAPGGTFGWKVNHNGGSGSGDAADYSQNDRNYMVNDIRHGCVAPCGHHFRIYKLRNAQGAVIPNAYLITVDLRGLNLDFNDNVWVITGIGPA